MSTASLDRRDALAHLRPSAARPGPRTAATMQNSVAPVSAVCLAASTSDGMSSQADADGGGEQAGLRAEVAVLGAAAGLERDDALDLDLRAAPAHPHLVREREQLGEAVVGQLQAPRGPAPRRGPCPPPAPARGRWSRMSLSSGRLAVCGRSRSAHGVRSVDHPRRGPGPGRARDRGRTPSGRSAPAPRAAPRPAAEPASVSQVARRCCASARSGCGGPGADHDPGQVEPPACQGLQRQRGVVERARGPAAATTSTGAPRSAARSASVPPSSSNRTSSPPAPSTSTRSWSAASCRAASATVAGRHRAAAGTAGGGGGRERVGVAASSTVVHRRRTAGRRRRGRPARPRRRRSARA